MHSTATVPNHVTLRRSTFSLLLGAAVVATATLTWGLVATVDSESVSPTPAEPTTTEILDRLSPRAREYVEGIMSMTPVQLAAAFGNGPIPAPATPATTETSDGL